MIHDLDIPAGNLDIGVSFNINEKFNDFFQYIQNMPLSVRAKIGITDDNYYEYFDKYISSPTASLYKKTDSADQYLVDHWLAQVAEHANFLHKFLQKKYEPIKKSLLNDVYQKFIKDGDLENIQTFLLEKGIYLIYMPALAGTKIDGAAFKIGENSVIGLSLRLKQLDSFCFTLIHELAHIVLHYDELDNPITDFFDGANENDLDAIEKQANRLARDILIPKAFWRNISTSRNIEDLMNYSRLYDLHPAILAGRWSFENNDWATYARLRNEYKIEV